MNNVCGAGAAMLAACCMMLCANTGFAARPNIILILTDDQGWWDVGVHGNPVLQTPHMDQLARDGVEFTHFYVSPVCSLTRASLLTGRHALRTGCFDTRFGHDTLAASEVTLADVLRSGGYRTGIFGKWHQGRYMAHHPNHRGFNEFFGFWQYGHVERYFYPDRMWLNKERVECRGHITELITSAAIDFIAYSERPFFCYVAYNVPHAPFQAPDELVQKYVSQGMPLRDAQIYALIEHCDGEIGRLLRVVDEQGLRENTVVLFLSDNGGISRHYMAGLRGSKGTLYEGGIRTPFFARFTGAFPAGHKVAMRAAVIDILPTLSELAGAAAPTDRVIDGISLMPWLRGEEREHSERFLYHMWSREVPRSDANWVIQDARYKLVNGQLFDLVNNEGESHDLAAEQPRIVRRLRSEYERWFAEVTAGQEYGRPPIEAGRADENPVELQMSWADLHGEKLRYTFDAYDWDLIDGWRQAGDAAEWHLQITESGRYEVSIAYGCTRGDAGGTIRVRAGQAELEATIEATPSADVFITRTIGALSLEAGAATLRVEVHHVPGGELMALNRVWMRKLP